MMSQTVAVKLVSLIANVVVAHFMLPDEAGLVGMAYSVLSIAGFVQYIGMQDVLIQRHARLKRWANPAFWMSLAVGIVGGGFVALAAPLAADLFHQPKLAGMVLLLALASPLQTTSVVPQAVLSAQLRFRLSVIINSFAAIGTSLLCILLAWRGWGAYSFLIPVPLMAGLQSAALWIAAHPHIQWRPQFRRWRYLVGDTGFNWGISICIILITTADHIGLSLWQSAAVVGIYFWAINLSTQLLRLLAMNLTSVLLPSLSRLQDDPERQSTAFLNSMRVLAMVGVPACLLQAAIAEPLVRLLYPDRWESMGTVLSVLSVGMAFHFISGPAMSIMKAQRRFADLFVLCAINAITVICIVMAISMSIAEEHAALAMSIGMSACLSVFAPLMLYLALRSAGLGWTSVVRIYSGPLSAAALAIGAALAAAAFIPDIAYRDLIVIASVVAISGCLYLLLIRLLDREVWQLAHSRLQSYRRSDSDSSASAATLDRPSLP
jgi:PST family polysaccharide transporter